VKGYHGLAGGREYVVGMQWPVVAVGGDGSGWQ